MFINALKCESRSKRLGARRLTSNQRHTWVNDDEARLSLTEVMSAEPSRQSRFVTDVRPMEDGRYRWPVQSMPISVGARSGWRVADRARSGAAALQPSRRTEQDGSTIHDSSHHCCHAASSLVKCQRLDGAAVPGLNPVRGVKSRGIHRAPERSRAA